MHNITLTQVLIAAGVLILLMYLLFGPQTASVILGRLIAGLVVGVFRLIAGIFRLLLVIIPAMIRRGDIAALWPGSDTPVLGPEDSGHPVTRKGDFLDYRGLATQREISKLTHGEVPTGRFISPQGHPGREISLPMKYLKQGCLVVGPTGSGKSENIILPWIISLLGQQASVVTVDVKGNLYDQLQPKLREMNVNLWYWNCADQRSQSWNWLINLKEERDIEAAVQSILGRKNPHDMQPFFYERDYRWLRAMIQVVRAAKNDSVTPQQLYRLLGNREAITEYFTLYPQVRQYENEIADLMQCSTDEYSKAVSGLLNALHLFNSPEVTRVSQRSDILLDDIGARPTLLLIGASLADAHRSAVLSSIMLSQLFNVVYRRFDNDNSDRTRRPIYFLIDEAARLRDRIDFDQVMSVIRSADAGMVLAAQDVTQFGTEQERSAILTNCLTKIIFRGCSPDTANVFSEYLGKRNEFSVTSSDSRNPWASIFSNITTKNEQIVTLPVLGSREIMHPPDTCGRFCALIHSSQTSGKPFLVSFPRIS